MSNSFFTMIGRTGGLSKFVPKINLLLCRITLIKLMTVQSQCNYVKNDTGAYNEESKEDRDHIAAGNVRKHDHHKRNNNRHKDQKEDGPTKRD
jgi:hypothetical protein